VCHLALLYATPVDASHMDRLQRIQNKFLSIILNAQSDTRTEDLHREAAEIESVDQFIAQKFFNNSCKHDHDNSLHTMRNTDNYNTEKISFKIRYRLSKHFQFINAYE